MKNLPESLKHLIRKYADKKNDTTKTAKNEESGTSIAAGGEAVATPFAFAGRKVPGNVRAAKQFGYELVKPIQRSPNKIHVEAADVTPAQTIEPVDTYKDKHGLVQHGDPELDPALAGKEQSMLPMYESRINNWYTKISDLIEGISGFKYLKTEADVVPPTNPPAQPPTTVPAQPTQQTGPQTQVVNYDIQPDFTNFDTKLKNSTEQLKVNFQKNIQDRILNKKVVVRASKGINQPESDYTVNVTGVNIDYFYDRYVVVVIGREENKRKTSRFLLKSGFKIKILGPADLKPKDKYQIAKSKAVVGSDQKGASNVVTSKEPPVAKKPEAAPTPPPAAPPAPKPAAGGAPGTPDFKIAK